MKLKIVQHLFDDEGEIPEVRLTERPFKARMVAEFAFAWSVDEAAEHYGLSKGAIYAAMAFYEDNREAIEKANAEDDEWLKENAVDGWAEIEKFKQRMKMKQSDSSNSS